MAGGRDDGSSESTNLCGHDRVSNAFFAVKPILYFDLFSCKMYRCQIHGLLKTLYFVQGPFVD